MARILYVITDLLVGGVPLHLRRLAGAMRERGFDVEVVSLKDEGPVGQMLCDDGIRVHACGGSGGWDARVISRLARVIRAVQPDLVHALLFHANLAARFAARLARFPRERVICEIQTVEVERGWHLFVDRLTWRGCRFTICNSPSVVEHLAARARIPRERLRLVRGGIDVARVRAAEAADRVELGLAPGERMVLWVGRLDPVKGLDVLLTAFARLDAGLRARLLLAGEGAERVRLEAQAAGLGLKDRVRFLGVRHDVPSLLKAADVFVFPSRTEGLPNALLEAMAAGCPIVTTDVPGCRDLVSNGKTGVLVPSGDAARLAEALAGLLSDSAQAVRLGTEAAEEVERHWSLAACWAGYEAAYRDAII